MLTIHKYPVRVAEQQIIEVPQGSKFLSAQLQNGEPTLWFMVDTNSEKLPYEVIIVGTGHPVPTNCTDFLGSVQQGMYVWHIFRGV